MSANAGLPLDRAWAAQAEAWTRWVRAPDGDPWHRLFNWPAFTELLPQPGRLTIDLGCGEGRVGVALRRRGHRLVGIDAAAAMAERARDTEAYDDVIVSPAAGLPLAAGVADLVVAYMSLHDIDDLGGALREAGRVLGPGGRLCAAIVHPFASARMAARYTDEVRYAEDHDDPTLGIVFHGVHRPLQSYLNGLADAAFTLEHVAEPVPHPSAVRVHPPLEKALERPPFLHIRARRA